jgi:predicted anti-sigma-YlaC factor YlaD
MMRPFTTGVISMDCRKIQEYFSAYLDGELPGAQEELVSRHLEHCPLCRQEYQAWQQLWHILAAGPVHAPDDLSARVLARLPGRNRPWWRNLALAASLLLGIFLGGKLGLEMHQTILPGQMETAQLTWEGFEEAPANSLDAMLVSYDLENGNGS